jgi:hypothetical protein
MQKPNFEKDKILPMIGKTTLAPSNTDMLFWRAELERHVAVQPGWVFV